MANEQILQKLKDALDAGVLTEEEYNKKVADIAGNEAKSVQEQPQEEVTSKEIPENEIPKDDGVVYFDANEKVKSTSGTSEGYEYYQNPSVNVGKKPKKKKKKWIIIGAIVLIVILLGAIGSCGGGEETYDWPADNEIAQMLPTPEGEITYISVDDEKGMENLNADVTVDGGEACKAYIEACKEKGFTENKDSSTSDGDYEYTAENKDGWLLNVYNFGDDMSIYLYSAEYNEWLNSDDEEETTEAEEETSADFKETMDEYEAFMDDYIAFMEKYNDSDDTSAMLSDYADMMTQYGEFAEKIDAIDEDSLSDSDYDYYIEVTTRVAKKLAKASL